MQVKLLDCTLRDGGYINNWNFGEKSIKYMLDKFKKSKIELIELGYYTERKKSDEGYTLYNNLYDLDKKLNDNNYVVMINYKEVDINNIPQKKEINNLFGIRVAFHKKDCAKALEYCKKIKDKGWNVFVQPMISMSYSDLEFKNLIKTVNNIKPYAFYIADSFGTMTELDVISKFKLIDKELEKDICIGFHSHNNLQLSYSNVISFLNMNLSRNILIDSSVYGMGRGAGNLNSELIIKYLNKKYDKNYDNESLLEIVDNCLIHEKQKNNWGYCLEYYLSAVNNCHPNYSKFLSELHTLTIKDINAILKTISEDKKNTYNEDYINELYTAYLNSEFDDKKSYSKLSKILKNKKIILLGGGSSIISKKKEIDKQIDDNSIVISLNNQNKLYNSDYVFISNKRRYYENLPVLKNNIICTSNVFDNIEDAQSSIIFDYTSNLAHEYDINDNVLLIFINILIKCKVKSIYLCGFDGFNIDSNNYYSDELSYQIDKARIKKINTDMKRYLELYGKQIDIEWITKSNYMNGGKK